MARAVVGISIGRRELSLAVVEGRDSRVVTFKHAMARGERTVAAASAEILKHVPQNYHSCEIAVALTLAHVACSDCFDSALRSQRQIDEIKGSLAEARCAGEIAEDLAVDAVQRVATANGSDVEIIAISRSILKELRSAIAAILPSARLIIVTSIPAALSRHVQLADDLPDLTIELPGEQVTVVRSASGIQDWRSFPVKTFSTSINGSVTLEHVGSVEARFAPAIAAALTNAELCANVLRDDQQLAHGSRQRFSRQAVRLFGAAAVLMLSIGLMLHRDAQVLQSEIDGAHDAERKAWAQFLPKELFRVGKLNQRMKERLAEEGKAREANSTPSALSLWAEMATAMPNADQLGMSLDTLQLGQEEARMQVRVNAPANDPLLNATQLEQALNRSEHLAARGEFENKGAEVLVRMRVDYKPTPKTGAPAAP